MTKDTEFIKKYKVGYSQEEAAYELGICNWPGREEDLVMGFWDDDCPECYEDLVRDHVVDMEFIPFDENGRIIMTRLKISLHQKT